MNTKEEISKMTTDEINNYLNKVKCSCLNTDYGNCFDCQNTGFTEQPVIVELMQEELASR